MNVTALLLSVHEDATATTLFTEITYRLSSLLECIDIGDIGLPEIQLPFVWPNTKVRDLFESRYRGFPVEYLLF